MSGPFVAAPDTRAALPASAFLEQIDAVDYDAMLGKTGPNVFEEAIRRQKREMEAATEVAQAAARLFATADGQMVLEHILDATLRRAITLVGASRDQQLDIALRREGGNAVAWMILALVATGRAEPPPVQKGPL